MNHATRSKYKFHYLRDSFIRAEIHSCTAINNSKLANIYAAFGMQTFDRFTVSVS